MPRWRIGVWTKHSTQYLVMILHFLLRTCSSFMCPLGCVAAERSDETVKAMCFSPTDGTGRIRLSVFEHGRCHYVSLMCQPLPPIRHSSTPRCCLVVVFWPMTWAWERPLQQLHCRVAADRQRGNQFMLMSSTVSTFFGFVKFLCVWEMCMCIGTIRYTSISSEIQILTLGISLSMFFLGG